MTEEILIDVKLDGADNEKKVDELTTSIDALTKAQKSLKEEQEKLTKTGKDNTQQYLDNAKQIEINKQKINENNASRKGLIQTIIAEDNSIKGLQVRNAELIKQRNLINTGTEEGRNRIKAINAELDKNNAIIKANVSGLEKQKIGIGDYAGAIDKALPGMGGFLTSMTSLLNPITAVGAGVGALIGLYAKSTIGTKDLEFASNQLSSAINLLGNSFASLFSSGKDGDGFISTMTNAVIFAIDPATAAISKLAALNIEKLEDLGRDSKRALAEQQELLAENAELLQQAADSTVVYNDKVFLTNQAIDNIRKGSDAVLLIRQEELKVLEEQLNMDKENEALQDAILDKELQISQEQKKTERQVNAILKLQDNLKQTEDNRLLTIQNQNEAIERQAEILEKAQENKAQAAEDELNLKDSLHEQLIEKDTAFDAAMIIMMEDAAKKSVDITKKKTKEQYKQEQTLTKLTELENQQRLTATSNYLGTAANAFKKNTIAYKALASAQTIIDTYQGATAAFRAMAGIPYVGPVLGAIAAAAAIAGGLANLAVINGVQFANGGKVPGFAGGGLSGTRIMSGHGIPISRSNGDNRLATVRTNEVILNERQQAALGGDSTFRKIGVPGFATGGIVTNETRIATQEANAQLNVNQLATVINQVRTVLVLQDFEAAQAAKNQPIATSQVIG